ncbi:hypothetical protein ID852_13240 [Xenorhabdus sp. 42]|uniref:hypothetical protein n=1 Tax=Xenorhabdus szentirmaii TaxID=290112 RepID=UPI00199E3761|nr:MULTISPECIES: hypothetical protein [unclassified Xenorhabdus]MBD2805568.1 hypothetical protein [Xenorhabdus sp. ZM]MBD2821642.1 hypothetical protein [Xenorhabdus sp. 42]
MMNWNIPHLKERPYPKLTKKTYTLWFAGAASTMLIVMLACSLVFTKQELGKFLLPVLGFTILIVILGVLLHLLVYFAQEYKTHVYNEAVEEAKDGWKTWANQHLGLLCWQRLTQPDENPPPTPQSPAKPNKNNTLKLKSLSGLPLWERAPKLAEELLKPIGEFWQTHSISAPLHLFWQTDRPSNEDLEWTALLKKTAEKQALPLADVQPLPQGDFTQWMETQYDSPSSPDQIYCLIFINAFSAPKSSEEAVAIVLAPEKTCRRLRLTPKLQLLRPLITPIKTLHDALSLQCEMQNPAEQLETAWHAHLPDHFLEKIQSTSSEMNMRFSPKSFHDTDSLLGNGGIARHAAMLTLAAERHLSNSLLVMENQGSLVLQQMTNQ